MMTIKDWKKEANRQMTMYACKDAEKFNYWLGFYQGLDNAFFAIRNMELCDLKQLGLFRHDLINELKQLGRIVHSEQLEHQYPHLFALMKENEK